MAILVLPSDSRAMHVSVNHEHMPTMSPILFHNDMPTDSIAAEKIALRTHMWVPEEDQHNGEEGAACRMMSRVRVVLWKCLYISCTSMINVHWHCCRWFMIYLLSYIRYYLPLVFCRS